MKPLVCVTLAFAALVAAPLAHADPSVSECLSATETSLHLRASHKLREARAQLLICSAPSCPVEVREECVHRTSELNAEEPTVVFAVKTRGGDELSAVKVTMDGEVVADHLDGGALSLDPGSHSFTFEAPGLSPLTEVLILHEGEKERGETVVLEAPAPSIATTKEIRSERRVLGIAIGAAGIAGLAVGGIFGGMASSAWNKASGECPMHTGCSAPAISDRNNAATFATVSTVGFIAGGVLVAGGLTIYLTAPKDKAPAVGLRWVPGGFVVAGTF
jgi:hypothetical protein